jgi:hypothetical protein
MLYLLYLKYTLYHHHLIIRTVCRFTPWRIFEIYTPLFTSCHEKRCFIGIFGDTMLYLLCKVPAHPLLLCTVLPCKGKHLAGEYFIDIFGNEWYVYCASGNISIKKKRRQLPHFYQAVSSYYVDIFGDRCYPAMEGFSIKSKRLLSLLPPGTSLAFLLTFLGMNGRLVLHPYSFTRQTTWRTLVF